MTRKTAPIRYYPDPVLRKTARPIRVFDKELMKIISLMEKTMKSEKHGIGIAAPQIGLSIQVAIVDVRARVKQAQKLILCNPKILEYHDERASREGCMSVPDYTANLKRYDWIRVRWQTEKGDFRELETSGIEAICIQHEIDHLHGKLFLDRVISLKRDMIPRPKKFR